LISPALALIYHPPNRGALKEREKKKKFRPTGPEHPFWFTPVFFFRPKSLLLGPPKKLN